MLQCTDVAGTSASTNVQHNFQDGEIGTQVIALDL
jgi:hypothetical protein